MSQWISQLNDTYHRRALQVYLFIVIAHWSEHLVQAWQVYVLHWPRHSALGLLGVFYPWLVHSEWMHYGYAAVMLAGLALLRPGFAGRGRTWWTISLIIQTWHFIEHLTLLLQAVTGHNMFGSKVPISFIQLLVPRIELHLFYNLIVFVPMIIGMIYHVWPPKGEARHASCTCAKHKEGRAA